MGVVLETGKLVTAAWVYHNWKRTPKLLKSYLISAVVVLMFITSMGIFGFLSKAHIEQTTVTSDNTLKIELIESQIQRERKTIERAESTLARLDSVHWTSMLNSTVTKVLTQGKNKRMNAMNSTQRLMNQQRQSQLSRRRCQNSTQTELQLKQRSGPIKYIAELIYGESTKGVLEDAVRRSHPHHSVCI